MSQNYKDPKTYLSDSITKRGKSGPEGVYLTSVTVVAESCHDYGYELPFQPCSPITPPQGVDQFDWYSALVRLRGDHLQFPVHIRTEIYDQFLQFIPEGGVLSLSVNLPKIEAEHFGGVVSYCQDILNVASNFTSKLPTHVRFSIGYAHRLWEEMAESGEVEEQDFTY